MEGIAFDELQRRGQGDGFQLLTTVEGFLADSGYVLAQRHGQCAYRLIVAAIAESIFSNSLHAFADGDACQFAVTPEHTRIDGSHFVAEYYAGNIDFKGSAFLGLYQVTTEIDGLGSVAVVEWTVVSFPHPQRFVAVLDADAGQLFAILEGMFSDAVNRFGNNKVGDACVRESLASDKLQRGGKAERLQCRAVVEGFFADSGDVFA